MPRKRSPKRFLLDTSAIVYHLHGHTLQQASVHTAVRGSKVIVPVFVRMEYLRGVILNLIEMWALIRESETIQDAFIDWSQKIKQERKLKVILMTVPRWLEAQEDSVAKNLTLRRLGDLIVAMIRDFDEEFPFSTADPLACVLGRLNIPRQAYDDDLLLDFHQRFKAVQESVPDCKLCSFRTAQRQRLRRLKVDLTRPAIRQRYSSNAGFVRQLDQVEEAATSRTRRPACSWCERLGDTIIALQANSGDQIVTADRAFGPLAELLGQSITLLPSLAELRRGQERP